jgi:hypothetical protein
MARYGYIAFVKFSLMFLTESEMWSTAMSRTRELSEKHGFKLLYMGTPYGTEDHFVYVFESDKPMDDWSRFVREWVGTGRPDGWKSVISIRTIPVNVVP